VILLYFLFGMAAIMLVNHPPNPRFTVAFIPADHLLTALMIVDFLPARESLPFASAGLGNRSRLGLSVAVILVGILSLPNVLSRYVNLPSLIEAQLETSPEVEGVYDWVAAAVPDDSPVYVVNFWDQFGPQQLEWELVLREQSSSEVIGRLMEPATPERAADFLAEVSAAAPATLVLIEGGPWGSPFWPDYSAALAGKLREVNRRPFSLTSHQVGDWLDANSRLGVDWEAVKAEAGQTLDINIIIYQIVN
jgi:hypothetical protein